jgi:hypothetical protein
VWKYLGSAGTTAIVVGALIFLFMMYSLSMFFPFRSRVVPKLLPSLPSPNDKEKRPLRIKEYGPGLWATGGNAEDKFLRENGVQNITPTKIDKE